MGSVCGGTTARDPQEVLREVFGYPEFRPHQREAVVAVCGGRSVLVVLPTGGGKSLVYQVPALVRDGVALVFSPLIALMLDQVDQLRAVGVRAAFLNSTLLRAERDAVQAQTLRGELDLLYVAPEGFFTERFQAFLAQLATVRNSVSNKRGVALIAVDEAHCISEWGHEFRPEYRKLSALHTQFPSVPIVACTATATAQVRADIVQQLGVPNMETIVGSFERANLTLHVERAQDATAQVASVLARHRNEAGIVYAATRKRVEELSETLNRKGFRTLPYHAGMDAGTRDTNQRAFANDEVETIVATVAFGMGIDKSNIRYVIHANLPKSVEGYYQEVGRAGRDGLPSECVTFYANGDIATQQYLIEQAESDDERARATRQLERVVRFVRSVECRHRAILRYFGEERGEWTCSERSRVREKGSARPNETERAGVAQGATPHAADDARCDVCRAGDLEERDVTEDAQKVLSAVARIERGGFPVGAVRIAQVLAGSSAQEVARFQRLPTFGTMRDRAQTEIRDIIGMCIDRGLLTQETGKYPVLRATDAAAAVLRGETRVVVQVQRVREVARVDTHEVALFETLRQWRAVEAKRQGVPPYVICSDKVLVDLATYLPMTPEDLPRVPGIGAVRAERHGAALLGIIRKYPEERSLTTHMDALSPSSRGGGVGGGGERARKSDSNTVSETLTLYQQGLSIPQIAEHRALNPRTIVSHLAECFRDGRIPTEDLRKFIPEDRERAVRAAFVRVGSLDTLSPIKHALPPDYSYDDLHLVRAVLEREGCDVPARSAQNGVIPSPALGG